MWKMEYCDANTLINNFSVMQSEKLNQDTPILFPSITMFSE